MSEKRSNDDQALSSMSGSYFQLLDPLNIGYVWEILPAFYVPSYISTILNAGNVMTRSVFFSLSLPLFLSFIFLLI